MFHYLGGLESTSASNSGKLLSVKLYIHAALQPPLITRRSRYGRHITIHFEVTLDTLGAGGREYLF